MSDIVTRLYELVRTQAYRPFDEIVEAIITEAIAEIERLRARVEELEERNRVLVDKNLKVYAEAYRHGRDPAYGEALLVIQRSRGTVDLEVDDG